MELRIVRPIDRAHPAAVDVRLDDISAERLLRSNVPCGGFLFTHAQGVVGFRRDCRFCLPILRGGIKIIHDVDQIRHILRQPHFIRPAGCGRTFAAGMQLRPRFLEKLGDSSVTFGLGDGHGGFYSQCKVDALPSRDFSGGAL